MKILDMTAGNRNIWIDRNCSDAIFVDHRVEVAPDIVADSTALPFANETFDLIVFDPPHVNVGVNSALTHLYGHYTSVQIRDFVIDGSREAHRVGTRDSLLIFKWCDHDVRHERILASMAPWWRALFGHVVSIRSSPKRISTTQWFTLRKTHSNLNLIWS